MVRKDAEHRMLENHKPSADQMQPVSKLKMKAIPLSVPGTRKSFCDETITIWDAHFFRGGIYVYFIYHVQNISSNIINIFCDFHERSLIYLHNIPYAQHSSQENTFWEKLQSFQNGKRGNPNWVPRFSGNTQACNWCEDQL